MGVSVEDGVMINLDDSNLVGQALNTPGVFHADVLGQHGCKKVIVDGIECKYVIFADTNKGYVIRHKTSLDGKLLIVSNKSVCELLFGQVEVVNHDMERKETD